MHTSTSVHAQTDTHEHRQTNRHTHTGTHTHPLKLTCTNRYIYTLGLSDGENSVIIFTKTMIFMIINTIVTLGLIRIHISQFMYT